MDSYSNLFTNAIDNLNSNITTQLISSLQMCLEELEYQNSHLMEIYKDTYLHYYDAIKCFPLCEFVIKKIISYFLNNHKKSLLH